GPGEEHRAALGHRHHRDGVRHTERGEPGSFERVDRHVHLGRLGVPHPLPVVEHRGLVLLALPDHHDPVHGDRAEHQAHGVDRCLVRRLLVPPTHPPAGPQGGRLGHPHQLQREVAVRSRGRGIPDGARFAHVSHHPFMHSRMLGPGAPSKSIASSCPCNGRLRPCSRDSRRTSRAASTPSTVIPRRVRSSKARAGSAPSPINSPYRRFRPPRTVTRASPKPARPNTVSARPPREVTSSIISLTAWANRAAFAFRYSDEPIFASPSRIPIPMAATFFATVQYSTPTTSSVTAIS